MDRSTLPCMPLRFARFLRFLLILISTSAVLTACATGAKETSDLLTPRVQPPIRISDKSGVTISSQPGPLWVLVSGVDEHGLLIEAEVPLFASPGLQTESLYSIPSGTPASVVEIRHLGPQNLQRYYLVELLSGEQGWLSDYYIRRQAYLFNAEGRSVPLHHGPRGPVLVELPNVSPALLLDPGDSDWWQVQSLDGTHVGWVLSEYVKESSEEEFLQQGLHEHTTPTP